MNNRARILVVEDEGIISNFITAILNASDYHVLHASSGREAISLAASHVPDLVLLDLGLPDIDGMDVLQSIRVWSDMPVIVVSARQDEHEKVEALDAGANDYVTKPFGNSELLARIRTALRQYSISGEHKAPPNSIFSVGGLSIDYARRIVEVGGKPVHMTPNEYRILVILSQNAGRVMTHDRILREIWGPHGADSQVLRVNMANIRRKIEANPADPRIILTEIGVGYRMTDIGLNQ